MVSSVPRFPAKKSKRYNYSNNQTRYGQTILCVTVRKAVENDLSKHSYNISRSIFDKPISGKKNFYSILFFLFLVENIFGTTHLYIYDTTNFDVNTLNRPSTSHVGLKSRGSIQLEVLAKSATFKEGEALKCLFENK